MRTQHFDILAGVRNHLPELVAEDARIFRIVFRANSNSWAACRMLMRSICIARLTRAYTSTLNTSPASHKTQPGFYVCSELKRGGLLFDRHKPPFTRPFVGFPQRRIRTRSKAPRSGDKHFAQALRVAPPVTLKALALVEFTETPQPVTVTVAPLLA